MQRLQRNSTVRQQAAAAEMSRLAAAGQLTPTMAADIIAHFTPLRVGSFDRVFADDKVIESHSNDMTRLVASVRTGHALERGECVALHHGPHELRTVRVGTTGRACVLQVMENYFEVVRTDDPVLRRWLGSKELTRDVKCGYALDMDEHRRSPDAVMAPVVRIYCGAACGVVGAALVMWRSMEFNSSMPSLFEGHPIECSI